MSRDLTDTQKAGAAHALPSTAADEAQEECNRLRDGTLRGQDPNAFFDRLARRWWSEAAERVLRSPCARHLRESAEELLDLRQRWELTCVGSGAVRLHCNLRRCPCDDCVAFVAEAKERLGPKWRTILEHDAWTPDHPRLVDRESGWSSESRYTHAKPQSHIEANRRAWARRKEHAARLGVSPQMVGHDGRILARRRDAQK